MTLNANSQLTSALKLQRWLDKVSVEIDSIADDKIKNKFKRYSQELVGLLDVAYDEQGLFELPNHIESSLDMDFKSLVGEIPGDLEPDPGDLEPNVSDEHSDHTKFVLDELGNIESDNNGIPSMPIVKSIALADELDETGVNQVDDLSEQSDDPQPDDDFQHDDDPQPEKEANVESDVVLDEMGDVESKGILDRISAQSKSTAVNDFFASNKTDVDVAGGLDDLINGVLNTEDVPITDHNDNDDSSETNDDVDRRDDDDDDNGATMTIDNVDDY